MVGTTVVGLILPFWGINAVFVMFGLFDRPHEGGYVFLRCRNARAGSRACIACLGRALSLRFGAPLPGVVKLDLKKSTKPRESR